MAGMKSQGRELDSLTIGEIVADDFRTARVFERYGIDFCCGGKVLLATACRERGLDPAKLRRELQEVTSEPAGGGNNYASWNLAFLADYIVNAHHAFVRENSTKIAANIEKVARVHGDNHPEVIEIAAIFNNIAADMQEHLKEEEEEFFPALKRVDAARKADRPPAPHDLRIIRKFLSQFAVEHEQIGEALQAIRKLAKDYAAPHDACNTFTLTYQTLNEFEADLHKHVHLENNILFPKALELAGGK